MLSALLQGFDFRLFYKYLINSTVYVYTVLFLVIWKGKMPGPVLHFLIFCKILLNHCALIYTAAADWRVYHSQEKNYQIHSTVISATTHIDGKQQNRNWLKCIILSKRSQLFSHWSWTKLLHIIIINSMQYLI